MSRIRSAALALALAATAAGAQQNDRSTFYLIVGNDTLTVERSERTASDLRIDLFDRKSRALVAFRGTLGGDARVETVAQSIFLKPTDTVPAMRVSARFLHDSVAVERGGSTSWIRIGAGSIPAMNASAALIEQSIRRARAIGGDSVTIPQLVLPNGPSGPVTIVRRGDVTMLRMGGIAILATVSGDGTLLSASIPSQNARFARGPATSGPFPGVKSFAPPAGAPYSAQDVSFRTPGGITLRGTLTLPPRAQGARLPAIVTITGSGPQDRDQTPATLKAYRLYYQLADTLGRRGIAVLRLDDRGAGSDAGPPTVTTADLADDIRAAVAWLRARPEIDPARIGLVGHSEGGIIAPMVASTDSVGLGGIVIMAGSVSPGREIISFQQRYVVDSTARLRGPQREAMLAQYARNTDSVAAAMPWMKYFLEHDPAPAAARVRAPVLVLHGETDYQIPVAEAEKLASVIRGGGNRDVTTRVFPGLNHLFLPDAGVGFSYEKLPSFVVSPEVMGALAEWLASRLTR